MALDTTGGYSSRPDSVATCSSLLILGGGPIGLEMALAAQSAGKWGRITVVERSHGAGGNVSAWGHVRLFSPWALNTTPLGLAALDSLGMSRPDPAAFPTGRELIFGYLAPLWRYLDREGVNMLACTEAIAVSRTGLLKGQMKGRAGTPFTVLLQNTEGLEPVESVLTADALVDATGTTSGPRAWLGPGGAPAVGERGLEASGCNVSRGVPDVLGSQRGRFGGGKVTCVVGSGYSAITCVKLLVDLAKEEEAAKTEGQAEGRTEGRPKVVWCTRRPGGDGGGGALLYGRVENDPLPERDSLAALANAIADTSSSAEPSMDSMRRDLVRHLGGAQLTNAHRDPADGAAEGRLRLVFALSGHGLAAQSEVVVCDELIACVGSKPDLSLLSELHVHLCYATEGPMKLAAALMSAGGGGDCLAQVSPGPATLLTPEPGFLVLGHKSYGRGSAFLLRVGFEQVVLASGLLEEYLEKIGKT